MEKKHRIRVIRDNLGLTQEELGQILNSGQRKINHVENGRDKTFPVEWALILREKFNINIEYTLFGIEPVFNTQKDMGKLEDLKEKYKLNSEQLDFIYHKLLLNPGKIDVLMEFVKKF